MKTSLFSSILSRRISLAEIFVPCNVGHLRDALGGHACMRNAAYSTGGQNFAAT
ncbi:hypothetical protein CRG98_024535, partial [Punica granatum]